jgi:WD40 repeat protein
LALSPDDSVVAQCDLKSSSRTSPADLDTWRTRTGALLHAVRSPSIINTVDFSPDSRRYVFATPNPLPTTAHLSVTALARAEGHDGTFVHDTATGRRVIAFPESASAAAFSPNRQVPELVYATVGDDLGHVYSFASHLNHALTGATDTLNAVRFDQYGTDVVTASSDGTARIYSGITGGLPLETLAGSASALDDAGFGRGDTSVATASTDGTVRVWAGPLPQPTATLTAARLSPNLAALTTTIGFTSDSQRIVQASQIGQGQVLDARTLMPLARFTAPAGQGFVGAQPTRDGRIIAALSGPLGRNHALLSVSGAESYDAQTGRRLATMTPTGEGGLVSAALDQRGDTLVTLGANGSADLWDARTGKLLHHLPGNVPAQAAVFSQDGSQLAIARHPVLPPPVETLATYGRITIDLYDAQTGLHERTIVGHPLTPQVPGGRMFAPLTLAFSPDGSLLAVSGADQGVEVYQSATGQLAHEPLGIGGAPGELRPVTRLQPQRKVSRCRGGQRRVRVAHPLLHPPHDLPARAVELGPVCRSRPRRAGRFQRRFELFGGLR